MVSKTRLLVKGSLIRSSEFFAGAIIGLILMPFIIRSLGDKMYGLWIFIGSFLGYYGLMDFGLNSAVQRYISREVGRKDYHEVNKVVNTSLLIFSLIGVFALLISGGIAFLVPLIIKNVTEVSLFRKVVFILGMNFALGFPLRVFSGVLYAHVRYDLNAIIELVKLTLRTILIIIFLKRGYGIVALAMITFILDISGYLTKYFLVRYLYKLIKLSRDYIAKEKVRALFSYSVFTFIARIADQLRFNFDSLVIVTFMGLSSVTLYSIGSRLIRYLLEFVNASIGLTMPIFSQYEGLGDFGAIKEKYVLMTKISTYLGFLLGGTLIIFGKDFMLRWMGNEYVKSYTVLVILIIGIIGEIAQITGTEMLYGLSKHKYFTISNSIEGLANLFLSVILVKHYGIFGVALGTTIPMLIMKLIVQPIYVCKVLDLGAKYFYLNIFIPIALKTSIVLLLFWLFMRVYIKPDYLIIAVFVILEVCLSILIMIKTGFTSKEKSYLKEIIVKMR